MNDTTGESDTNPKKRNRIDEIWELFAYMNLRLYDGEHPLMSPNFNLFLDVANNAVTEVDLDSSNIEHVKRVLGMMIFNLSIRQPAGRRSNDLIADPIDFAIDVHSVVKDQKPKPLFISDLARRYCKAKGVAHAYDAARVRLGAISKAPESDQVAADKLAEYRNAVVFITSCRRGASMNE